MLGVAATLIGDKIRTDVQRELGGIGRATGEYSVDIDLNTLTLLYVDSHHILTDKLLSIIAYYQDDTIHSFPWNFEAQIREQERTLYLVVRHNDEMVGFAGCDMKYATYEAHITNIAVLPPYQNLGLGQMLIKTLIDEADKRGLRKVSLEVRQSNVNAHEAYRFAGFVDRIVKKDYYTDSPAEDAIEMVYSTNANKRKERMTNG